MTVAGWVILICGVAIAAWAYFYGEERREACERAGGVLIECGCLRRDVVVQP